MLTAVLPSLAEVLATRGLADATEKPFPNDGWSGSRLTLLEGATRRLVLKRTSWSLDWIVRATDDRALREAWVASGGLPLPDGVVAPYLGAARDADGAALLLPDLSSELISWAEGSPQISTEVLDRILARLAALHRAPWWPAAPDLPWCPIDRRVTLLTRPSAERYQAEGLAVGGRFLAGWEAFDRRAPAAARDLIARLAGDVTPLTTALADLPPAGLHGDLKLANVALLPEAAIGLIDWQMTMVAPVAVELGWLLVSNVAQLPLPPEVVLDRYRTATRTQGVDVGDWAAQRDLAWIVGLLLRGWRKGLDAEAGGVHPSGRSAEDDLAWWSRRAVEAGERRL